MVESMIESGKNYLVEKRKLEPEAGKNTFEKAKKLLKDGSITKKILERYNTDQKAKAANAHAQHGHNM